MAISDTPNGGLINETNQQYYAGSQSIISEQGQSVFTFGFDTDMIFKNSDPAAADYSLNNFKVYTSPSGVPGSWIELTPESEYWVTYSMPNRNQLLIQDSDGSTLPAGTYVTVQLKTEFGGNYGDQDAYGYTVEENYGGYAYIKISDVVNNFMLAYVGAGKLIPSVKKTDVIFHAKRALQELSYDTLSVVKSQELTIPHNLSIPLPQDYVNLVAVSRIDNQGVKHPIFQTNLSGRPYRTPVQDDKGIPIQDDNAVNIDGTSQINKAWDNNDIKSREELYDYWVGLGYQNGDWPQGWGYQGDLYGLQPELANVNGYFMLDKRSNKISFSNDLIDKLILLEYISDGLAYDADMKVPKLAEEAIYSHVIHAIISTRINQPEYVVRRLKQERSAKIRNAKIRLSNIKPNDLIQVMRGKSKWIKH